VTEFRGSWPDHPAARPDDVTRVLARWASPPLEPERPQQREGVVASAVFPTAIDSRGDGVADVFYGMADTRIGAFPHHAT
jgi:beta-1,2-mannobiose phosphorylase / 1,2-beta-oligomannan phosphorylase